MVDPEYVEKVRQAIMRYRELMNLLHVRVIHAERAYDALFNDIPEGQRSTLQEKALQREAALRAIEDMEPLRRAVLRVRYDLYDIEHEFDALYNNIAPEEPAESAGE